ncbi:MAG: hypothetical protein Q3999_02095, partial [Buchananella hordeovulneris]|nr:hypothetical protein [Buchananella hordeovulneris]
MAFSIFSLLPIITFPLLPIVDSPPVDEDFHSDQASENMVEIVGNKSWGGDKTYKPPSKELISIDFDPAKIRERTEADAWQELAADRDSYK